MESKKIVLMALEDIKPYKNNPRNNDEAVEMVASSIKEFGFKNPIIVDKDNIIIAGHTRLKAAYKLGLKEAPVIVADDLTEDQANAFRLVDNRTSEVATWNFKQLEEELKNIDLDMNAFDFNFDELKEIEEPKDIVEDEAPEVDEENEPITKLGDIYQLGNHRLMCGDSTSVSDVEKLMKGSKADMVFTDPPYNVDYSNADRPNPSKTDLGKIKNDIMLEDEFDNFLSEIYKRLDESTKDDCSFYIWYADKSTISFYKALKITNIKFSQLIIWKKPMLLGRSRYQWSHEPCIFAVKGHPYFTEDRKKTTVWDFGGYDKSKNVHPTQKPLFLPVEAIENSSLEKYIVLDLFGGSGSTLIACEQLNRNCYMMELDPKYCDVIIKRWETLTGKKSIKL